MKKGLLFAFMLAGLRLFGQSYDLAITEIMYNPDSSLNGQDWVELYNYGKTQIDISGWLLKSEDVLDEFEIPDGTILQPGEFKVIAQWEDTFHMVYPTVSNVIGDFEFGLDNGGGQVRLFNGGGAPVIQISYGDTLPWPKSADGYGMSLEVDDYTAELNDPSNWFGGCVGGSPGSEYSDCNYSVQLSEINYNSIFYHDSGDWIELVNSGIGAIDISDWSIRDSKDNNVFHIPAGTILEAGAHLVVCTDIFQYTTYYPAIDNLIGDLGFGFSGQGDAVRIYDNEGILQYGLYYHDDPPWADEADGNGFTLELLDFYGTPNVPGAWTAGCPYGSPGTAIILPCPAAVEDYELLPFTAGPNPFNTALYLRSETVHNGLITITDLQGRPVYSTPWNGSLVWNGQNGSGEEVASGLYLVRLQTDGEQWSMLVVKE